MSERTYTILVSAAVVAAIYVAVEFMVKPKVGNWAGVKVR